MKTLISQTYGLTAVSSPDSVVAKRLPLASSNPEGEADISLPPLGEGVTPKA